jgi:hypothetical protein
MGDTDMAEADRESGGGRNTAGQIKRRKIVLELEGLPYDPVERINPDGSVVMLPPQDAEDEVAAPFRAIFPHPPPDFPFKSPVPAPFRCITTRRNFTSLTPCSLVPPSRAWSIRPSLLASPYPYGMA